MQKTLTPRYVPDNWRFGAVVISLALFALEKLKTLVIHLTMAFSESGQAIQNRGNTDVQNYITERIQIVTSDGLVYSAAWLAFLLWFYQAHKNLIPLGTASSNHTPKWSVIGFFIPILNAVYPLVAMLHVNDASGPDFSPTVDETSKRQPGSSRIVVWWLLIIFGFLFDVIRTISPSDKIQPITNLTLSSVSIVMDIAAICMTIVVVVWIERRQELRAVRIGYLNSPQIPQPSIDTD